MSPYFFIGPKIHILKWTKIHLNLVEIRATIAASIASLQDRHDLSYIVIPRSPFKDQAQVPWTIITHIKCVTLFHFWLYRYLRDACWKIDGGNMKGVSCRDSNRWICERNLVLTTLQNTYQSSYKNLEFILGNEEFYCTKKLNRDM